MPRRIFNILLNLLPKKKPKGVKLSKDQLEKITRKLTVIVLFDNDLEETLHGVLGTLELRFSEVQVKNRKPQSTWRAMLVHSIMDQSICGASAIQDTFPICHQLNDAYSKSGMSLWTPETPKGLLAFLKRFDLINEALRLV
jgi:hypothetical protein